MDDKKVWSEFCDSLKRAGDIIDRPMSPADPFNRAEGYRCLTRYLRAGLESFVETDGAEFPQLKRNCHETIKIIADNPDVHYQSCGLRSDCDYRLVGTRGTVDYIGFGTQSGGYGSSGTMDPTGSIDTHTLQVEQDGSFELAVSQQRHEGNWLPMTEASNQLIIRQTFLDRKNENIADISIEKVGPNRKPEPLNPETFARGLRRAAKFVEGTSNLMVNWAEGIKPLPNQLPPADQEFCQAVGGDPNFYYFHGYWCLEDDEALIIEPESIPEYQSWNFQLDNYWMESLDYRYFKIHLNKHIARHRDDGTFRIIIAHQDPGLEDSNWIETAGHYEGTMCFRWVRAITQPPLRTRVAKLWEL